MIFKFPFAKKRAPPPDPLVTELPVILQLLKVTVAPALLLKRTAPPARVVLFPEKVRSLKVTSADVAPFIVKSLVELPSPIIVELASKPSIVKTKLLEVKFAPDVVTIPMIISLSPSEFISSMAVPKSPYAFSTLVPSILPAPMDAT